MPITAAFAGSDMGPESRRSPRTSEIVAITGGAAGDAGVVGDTTTYRPRHSHKNPQIVGGAFAIASISQDLAGVTITLEARVAVGDAKTVWIEVIGEP